MFNFTYLLCWWKFIGKSISYYCFMNKPINKLSSVLLFDGKTLNWNTRKFFIIWRFGLESRISLSFSLLNKIIWNEGKQTSVWHSLWPTSLAYKLLLSNKISIKSFYALVTWVLCVITFQVKGRSKWYMTFSMNDTENSNSCPVMINF